MCNIKTLIDLKLGILFVESPRCKEKLQIKLKPNMSVGMRGEIDIHAQRHEVQSYGNEVNGWFSDAIGQSCTLLRNCCTLSYTCSRGDSNTGICKDVDAKLNFVNEAQLLLVSEESVADLNNRLRSSAQKGSYAQRSEVSTMRFRPNLVISGGEPYAEDGWKSLEIGGEYFTSFGGCNRCQLINIYLQGDKVQRSNEPLATLAAYRRVKGKILFGILLRYEKSVEKDSDAWLHVGDQIVPNGYSLSGRSRNNTVASDEFDVTR